MKKKTNKYELEEAINNLDVSFESKKAFAFQLRLRNESMGFSYVVQAIGIIFLIGYFGSMSQLHYREFGIHMIIPFWMGIFFIIYARSRINTIKLQRATVELILRNKGS
ncbi:MAG: hypothetical protein K9M45_07610 [Kiritimatiellales bacterium]|nr:hypothetical protein [Kiritimatiellales bacterium]